MQDDEELERLVLAHSVRLRAILETARQQIREGEGISHEDFWQEVDERNLNGLVLDLMQGGRGRPLRTPRSVLEPPQA